MQGHRVGVPLYIVVNPREPDEGTACIGDYPELSRALAAEAEACAAAETQARADLEARLREMEAELRRLQGEA